MGVCVTSNKYVAACAALTELLSHEQTRPAATWPGLAWLLHCSMFRPVSPEPRVPASPGPSHRHCSTLACPCEPHGADQVTTKTISSCMRKVLLHSNGQIYISRFFSFELKVQVDSCLIGCVRRRGRGPGILSEAQQVELGAGAGRWLSWDGSWPVSSVQADWSGNCTITAAFCTPCTACCKLVYNTGSAFKAEN